MTDLSLPPEPLTRAERTTILVATTVVALTRLLAVARSPWDWDEMLFLLGLRDYDVALHHPHPPGFPLFMLLARALVSMGIEPFRSLQAINLTASVVIIPAMVFLGRELRLPFATNISAAILFAFFPNVWFFGGTGFSDVAAIVLAVTAIAMLLRGARSSNAFIGGAFLLAIAAGFRPQNLLVGLLPLLIAAWYRWRARRIRAVIAGAAIIAAVVVVSYAGAIAATGEWSRYRDAVLAHQRYLAEVDSFVSPTRPSLLRIADDFFVRPFRISPVNVALTVLAVISLVTAAWRRRWPVLIAAGAFGPFWILAWLTLDFHSASRFSIGYMPLLAILVADAVTQIASVSRSVRAQRLITAAFIAGLAGSMAFWTLPGIFLVRNELSPPMQAIAHLRDTARPDATIYVQKRMRPFAEYFLGDLRLTHLEEAPPPASNAPSLYLREGVSGVPDAKTFAWPRDPLWNIARRRYFAVAVVPLNR
ncbi:MAG TPA: hypothetical protein VFM36_02040 [Thermoanaerobaculia bacterium]|nr:hypothetical protein [Thermoanaerobaculia bacterium]